MLVNVLCILRQAQYLLWHQGFIRLHRGIWAWTCKRGNYCLLKKKKQVLPGKWYCCCQTHWSWVPAGVSGPHFAEQQFHQPDNSRLRPLLAQRQQALPHKSLQRTHHNWNWTGHWKRWAGSCPRLNCVWKTGFPLAQKKSRSIIATVRININVRQRKQMNWKNISYSLCHSPGSEIGHAAHSQTVHRAPCAAWPAGPPCHQFCTMVAGFLCYSIGCLCWSSSWNNDMGRGQMN